ncbi:MAG: polysaccharide deacetylase family protein [Oscillospiraceae bacterium]
MKEAKQNKVLKILTIVLAALVVAMSISIVVLFTKSNTSITTLNSQFESVRGAIDEKDKEYSKLSEENSSQAEFYSNAINEQNENNKKENQSLNNKISELNKQISIKHKTTANNIKPPESPSVSPLPNNNGAGKTVYLTFDDGPSSNTPEILRILNENGVKATFFVKNAGKYNHYMKDIVDSGNAIALHTATHDYKTVYASDEAYYNDLNAISNVVFDQTGVRSNVIRFPGGSSNAVSKKYNAGIMTRLVKSVEENGYHYFDWNVSSGDATGNNIKKEILIANCKSIPKSATLIVLMHDTNAKGTTVEALPEIIAYYKSIGCDFGIVTAQTPPIHHGLNN